MKINSENTEKRTLRIAAVQVHTEIGQTQRNLDCATPLIEQAAREGAQVIALPEMAATGYSMSKLVWDSAETRSGQTVEWLGGISRRLGVYVGTGFTEADGSDFYNTYALAAPDGLIAGFVRKSMAETYCWRSEVGSHVIETEIGRIGVGICADNLFVANLHRMQDNDADILLMPHAAPLPFRTGGLVKEADILDAHDKMSRMASTYAPMIGIPTVFINQVGPRGTEKWAGIFGAVMNAETFHLGGLSTIVGHDGTVLAQLDEVNEGVISAEVTLDPDRKVPVRAQGYGSYGGGFVTPHPFLFEAMCYTDAFFCGQSYRFSAERKSKARAAAANG